MITMIKNLQELKASNRIIFECVAGSVAYNINDQDSDEDIRGIYINPSKEYLTSISEPLPQIGSNDHDIVYYSLKRFLELASTANPNIIELLWMPDFCTRIKTQAMQDLIKYRDVFITKQCYQTHASYAHGQVRKAKGENKWINNPKSKEKPTREDFCFIIDPSDLHLEPQTRTDLQYCIDTSFFPMRPHSLKRACINLEHYHAASLEHAQNMYRLYYYGNNAKGVFRADGVIACQSIPKEDEWKKFKCFLIYNDDAYQKETKEWNQYWEWIRNRNPKRWLSQEKKEVDYNPKNMSHCLRLLLSCENIFTKGYPLVRFEGESRKHIMDIKQGHVKYDELMAEVDELKNRLEKLHNESKLPDNVDSNLIDDINIRIMGTV